MLSVLVSVVHVSVVLVSVVPAFFHISFNLLSQPESGVATPPKKLWPPIGGDRRVSVAVEANQDSLYLAMGEVKEACMAIGSHVCHL